MRGVTLTLPSPGLDSWVHPGGCTRASRPGRKGILTLWSAFPCAVSRCDAGVWSRGRTAMSRALARSCRCRPVWQALAFAILKSLSFHAAGRDTVVELRAVIPGLGLRKTLFTHSDQAVYANGCGVCVFRAVDSLFSGDAGVSDQIGVMAVQSVPPPADAMAVASLDELCTPLGANLCFMGMASLFQVREDGVNAGLCAVLCELMWGCV